MNTLLTDDPEEAARILASGQLVAFPTETVYGLGADALDLDAVHAIFDAKGRPSDNPLIVHVASESDVAAVARDVSDAARVLMERFFPGPLTLILPKRDAVPDVVTAGLDTVGVRMPRHPVAMAFLEACGTPVAAPSANRSGRPSPTTWKAVYEDLDGRIACILKGGRTDAGVESTVVDCTTDPPAVLRPGAVSLEVLREALQEALPGTEVRASGGEGGARSPGTRHRHYAPDATVLLVEGPDDAPTGLDVAYVGLDAPADPESFGRVLVARDVEHYAHELFHYFRRADALGCRTIAAQIVPDEGLGRALNDRLRRAAEA